MSDALGPMRANMRAFYRLVGGRSPDGQVLDRRGLVAAFVPSCPNRSIVNAVVFERHDELAALRDELASRYEDAGIRAWTVWVQQGDRAAAELLQQAGHHLDANGEFAAAMSAVAEPPAILYLARVDGSPAACLGVLDEADDCGVYFVATAPSAQRRGLASALLREALLEARERGCGTSSLQATAAGQAVYARLGYRDICALEMWEYRRSWPPGQRRSRSLPFSSLLSL